MTYTEYAPKPKLKEWVKQYWWFENDSEKSLHYTILPDGCFDLILTLQNGEHQELALTGIWTRQVEVTIQPGQQLFGIRFQPQAAEVLFRKSIAVLCDSEALLSPDFWECHTWTFDNLPELVSRLDQLLTAKLQQGKQPDPRFIQLFRLLESTHGILQVDAYAAQVSLTGRQINRYFNSRFGISLKTYCKILKVRAAYDRIEKGELHPEEPYFDQSHFIKDVRQLTGMNPKALHENENDRFLQLTTRQRR